MAATARLSPLVHPWLAPKVAGLLVYIALGAVALRHRWTLRARRRAFTGAVLAFACIVDTALSRDPLWPLHAGA
jgi:uncharacterized membrane protein SirB2